MYTYIYVSKFKFNKFADPLTTRMQIFKLFEAIIGIQNQLQTFETIERKKKKKVEN